MTVDDAKLVTPPKLKIDEENHRNYTSQYQVIADVTDGPMAIRNANGIPAYGSSFAYESETDTWAFCKSIDANPSARIKGPSGERIKHLVTVVHSTKPSGGSNNPNNQRDDPLDEDPVIGGSFVQYSKPAHRDRNNIPILNTAKEPYTPPVEVEDAYDTLTISYNTATISLGFRAGYRNTVNSSAIWGLPKRRAKIVRWDWKILYAGTNMAYVRHDFEFHISYKEHPTQDVCTGAANNIGWYTTLPNSGTYYWPAGWGPAKLLKDESVKFMDKEDQPVDVGNLTCDGDDGTGNDQTWNVFEVEYEKDFTAIPGMPDPLPGPFS